MKIIKMGIVKKKVLRRTCIKCGTIFECEKNDIKHGYSGMDNTPCKWVDCPVCGLQIDISLSEWYRFDIHSH